MPESDIQPIRPEVARDQAAEFFGVFAGQDFDLGDGQVWHLPNPNYLPRDMKRRYLEHLHFMKNGLDKEPAETHPVTGKKQKPVPKWPLCYKGELIDDEELLCIALMGTDAKGDRAAYFKDGTLPEVYQQFLDAGGAAGQVQLHWRVMNLQMEERVQRDPKSR